jgi:proteasome lid subunit RPN8/RPN11
MSVTKSDHRFVAELIRADKHSAGEATFVPDWEPAASWTALAAAQDHDCPKGLHGGPAQVDPVWAADGGQPYVEGFRVRMVNGTGRPFACDFGLDYLDGPVHELARQFVQQGKLAEGESYTYRVSAYPIPQVDAEERAFGITVANTPLRVVERPIGDLMARSREVAPERAVNGDLPVFIPQQVVDEATGLALANPEEEVGGVLIGQVCRDPRSRAMFIEVTAQIPAVHTQSTSTSLTFTAETWAAVRSAVDLRNKGEIWLGSFHTHPARAWCAKCAPERRAVCPLRANFFSTTDVALHRAVFLAAYCVALVVTDSESGIDVSMFGWRRGRVMGRSFRVIDGRAG